MATLSGPQTRQKWPEQGEWTYEDWLALPDDGFRYEVLDGELYMSPSPTIPHQDAVTYLVALMRLYADEHDLGKVLTSPVGVRLPDQPVPVQPDVVFVSKERADIIEHNYIEGAPDLVVEILSPSNWMYDRGKKQEAYRLAGVKEYWIGDYRAKTIDVLVLDKEAYILVNQYQVGDVAQSVVLAGFTIAVANVFK
jgi:Uma2 family endonuclease